MNSIQEGAVRTESSVMDDAADEPVEVTESPVNYDDEGVGEVELEGVVYRFDSGKQGTALCLSCRAEGSWTWQFMGEMRWDGRDLRSKMVERRLLGELSLALRKLAAGGED